MFALQLLLSPYGHMNRLNYILLSGLFGAMNGGLLLLMGLQNGAGIFEMLSAGPLFLFTASPWLAAIFLCGLWIHTCFVFKRSRDFSGATATAWILVALWLAPYVAPELSGLQRTAFSGGAVRLLAAIPAGLVSMVLFFARSREIGIQSHDKAGRGEKSDVAVAGLGMLNEHTDLVARAAALTPVQSPSISSPDGGQRPNKRSEEGRTGSSGFGRRKSAHANTA